MILSLSCTVFGPSVVVPGQAMANRSRGSEQNPQVYEAELRRILSKNKSPCKQDSECVALKLGALPCGGPREFLIVEQATLSRVEREATDLLSAIAELEKVANRTQKKVGTCIANDEPKMKCIESSCRPRPQTGDSDS